MAKDTFYFSHDYNARNDIKIKKMMVDHGMLGYGIYWSIIEDLYNNANALPTDYKTIAYALRVDENIVEAIITNYELFVFEDTTFGSLSVEKRIDERNQKSLKASKSANKRWNKSDVDANALPPKSEGNAIKESKGKERKGKESISARKLIFAETLKPFVETYGRPMLDAFYKYWVEPNRSKTKFRQELERTWELERRLETWASRDKTFDKSKTSTVQIAEKSSLTFK